MSEAEDKRVVKWIDLALSSRRQDVVAAVHPIALHENRPCVAVTLDQRWLCGSDGALTFFDSMSAATRFLSLLRVNRFAPDGGDADIPGEVSYQCFQLDAQGITACSKCRIGFEAQSRSAREFAQQEERW